MYANGYSYRRKITVDNTKVAGSSDFTDFPALFYGTYSYLATVANGGKVTSSSGNDIRFETTGGTKLDHELASYSATTGAIEAHIRIPTLGATADTEIYVYYGKSGASAEQNPTGVWGSSYKAVWHLNEASGTIADSTSNNVDSTSQTITAYGSTGEISKAVDVTGSSDTINFGDVLDLGLSDVTISMWLKTSQTPANYAFTLSKSFSAGGKYRYAVGMYGNPAKPRIFLQGNGGSDIDFSGGTTINNNAWHLVHYTFDRDGNATIYVDGASDGSASIATWSAANFQSSHPFRLGAYTASNDIDPLLPFNGYLDEVRFAFTLLSSDWIATEYNNQNAPATFYSVGSEETPVEQESKPGNIGPNIEVGNGMSRSERAT